MGTNSAPSPQELQTLITQHALDRVGVLEKLLSHAPDSALPSLLLALVDAGIEDNSSGTCTTLKQLLSQPSVSKVCGKVFQKGDLVWTCKQCGKDGTCVLCHACFERSHHPTLLPHHEVYFHRNQSGSGCCDCGDPEAWKKEGCCALHSEDLEASGEDTKDLTSLLPLPLRENLSAVLKSLMRLLTNHCIQTLLGHNPRCEIGLQGEEEEGVFVLRLHNDDVHDFEEVTTALMTCGMTRIQATGLTNKVDREGSAAVRQGAWSEVFWMASELLAANLLVSIVAKDVHEKDLRMAAALHWLTSLAANENVRRLVTEILLLPFEDCEHYPLRLPYLDNLPSSVTSLFPSINGPLQSRIPVIALSLLMIYSPFQVKDMQTALNSLVLKYQHDTLFKKAFTQLLCSVYPSLSLLFARFVGTDAESLLNTTVQVFTSASMADLMSSEGVGHRIFPEADAATPVYILPHLMRSLRVCLMDAGADAVGGITAPSTAFLAQNVLTKSRLLRVCRDIEYVASNASIVRVLQKVRDPSAMEEWLCVLCLLQELYPMRRQRGDHVEREDGQWQTAASLVLEIESVSDALIRGAFALPQPQMGSSSLGGRLDSTPIDGRAVAALAVLDIAEVICRRLVPTLESTVPNSRQFLGHTVTLPAKLTPPTLLSGNTDVSILLPLHRFAAKLIGAALKANVNLGPVLNNLKSNLLMSLGLLELPLKSLAWFAQVSVGMWRRNGDAVSSLAYNYSRIALGKHMMDADIMLIQTSMLSLGSDVMLITLLDCLELVEVLDSGVTTKEKREYAGPLIAEFLRLLILIITKLPVTLSSEMILKEALKRQVAPLLLSGATLPSMVDSCRRSFKDVTVGPETSNGCRSITIEELVREVVKELASTREAITINAETPSMMLLTPNPASLLYFNCEDTLLPRAELEKATELVRALQKQAPQQDLTSRPMVDRKALAFASASPSFVFVLSLLQSPLFLLILDKIIELIIRAEHRSFTDSRALILGRVLYLLTLQLHSISLEEACICWESETGKAIFQKILTIREGNMVAADEMHLQGLAWIMEELSTKVPAIQRELVAKGYGKSTGSSLTRTDESSRRRRKVRAQRQSMDEIQSRAAKFMAEMELEGGKNANEEASIEERKVLHLDQAGEEEEDVLDLPVCVVCRESEAESSCSMDVNPLGYFTFLQPSTVLKHATARDIHENRFVVVLEEEAFIFSSPSLDAMKVGRLLHGDIVDISSREGRWVQIQEPAVASHLSSTRRDTACRLWVQVYTDSHGGESGGVRVRPVLFPLAELCFNQFGPSRLFGNYS